MARRRYESRLSRKSKRDSEKSFILSIIGIIVILLLFVKFGLPGLINLSSVISGNKNDNSSQNQNSSSFVAVPFLNSTYDATNSAQIAISGNALPKETIQLFVNNQQFDTIPTKDDGSFSFSSVKLSSGQNTISAKAVDQNNKESDFSNQLTVSYISKQPTLTISSPSDGQSLSKLDQDSVQVKGTTDPGDKVTVNGFWAIVDDGGNYSYALHLSNGSNQIEVIATDQAGNQARIDIHVSYSSS